MGQGEERGETAMDRAAHRALTVLVVLVTVLVIWVLAFSSGSGSVKPVVHVCGTPTAVRACRWDSP